MIKGIMIHIEKLTTSQKKVLIRELEAHNDSDFDELIKKLEFLI